LIVAGGWAKLEADLAPSETVIGIRDAPHHALFPRVAAVVHHGGAGTTTAAARAGVPQLILPHILDQYYWASRVAALGLGPAAVPVEHATATRLTEAVRQLFLNRLFHDRARTLCASIAGRNGVASAATHLERSA
jgi:UDP:flavonoid glycosyltransferase YjiC (YdhE family)